MRTARCYGSPQLSIRGLGGVVNINEPLFDEPRERPGFRALRARLGRQTGCQRLGLSLWSLPPGEAAYPYHYHLTEEELAVVLDGCPSLLGRPGDGRAAQRAEPAVGGARENILGWPPGGSVSTQPIRRRGGLDGRGYRT